MAVINPGLTPVKAKCLLCAAQSCSIFCFNPLFCRKMESSVCLVRRWVPAFAGMTGDCFFEVEQELPASLCLLSYFVGRRANVPHAQAQAVVEALDEVIYGQLSQETRPDERRPGVDSMQNEISKLRAGIKKMEAEIIKWNLINLLALTGFVLPAGRLWSWCCSTHYL